MAQVVRAVATPLINRQLFNFLSAPIATAITAAELTVPHSLSHHRHAHLQPRALRPLRELELELEKGIRNDKLSRESDDDDGETTEDTKTKKRRGRNEMKRQARQALRLGMDLSSFTTPQIKRILKAAALEEEVFEAVMLVKRLGPDVREGKRRQFNYIARLLREADTQPDLLGALIQATKDGDQSRFQALAGSVDWADEGPQEEFDETESDEEDEDSSVHILLARKWFDGLIQKEIEACNEVYSVDNVDFDRQELRKLVRTVHSLQDRQTAAEEPKESAELTAAKQSLNRFLCSLAKRHSTAQDVVV